MAVCLLLAVARRAPEGEKSVKNGTWGPWSPEWLLGREVSGSVVGVVGLGRIGKRFAEMMHKGFNCKILYATRDGKKKTDVDNYECVSFDELLKRSDFVVPHVSLSDSTRKMFNDEAFSKMKKTSIFINTTRGDVVDQESLYKALKEKKIFAAGIDVTTPEPLPTDSKLLSLPNLLVLPHMGSGTQETREKMGEIAATNVINGINGEKMIYEL